MLSALIQELGKEWELEQPIPHEVPGVYTIPLDEGVSLTVTSANLPQGGIVLSCSIAEVRKGKEESLFTHALLANLFGQGTKQAVLGLNNSGNILTLSRFIDYDVNFQEFRDIMEDFINTIDFWREEVLKY